MEGTRGEEEAMGGAREIVPLRTAASSHACCGRPMRKFAGAPSPRILREDGGATRQITVVRTVWDCDKCGRRETEEEAL